MSVKGAWAADTDLDNRDSNNLNEHLKITFEETIGEPDHTHSIDCVWKYSYKCFNMWKTLCYVIMSTLCGIPHAICWGCGFACVAFCHIWQITPCVKCVEIQMDIFKKMYGIWLAACITPFCEACGAIFSVWKQSNDVPRIQLSSSKQQSSDA